LLLGVYALVFRSIFKVAIPELGDRSFVEFVAVALWPWLAFQEGVQRGLHAILANSALVKKVAFPHELLVYGAVGATFMVHLVGYALVLTILALFGAGLHLAGILLTPLLLLLLLLLTIAVALPLAALQAIVRDTDQFMAPAFMILFYATPILYSFESVPAWLRHGMTLNPLLYFVEPIRELLLTGQYSPNWQCLTAWASVPFLFVAGLAFFRRLSPHFEDFL
jgi:ABC-type polysaccharide/polyol phosphate export permease